MLNVREMDVLAILWNTDEEMTAIDIVNEKKELTQSTVTAVLRGLLKRGLVEVRGMTHSGKVLSRTYRPTPDSITAITEHFVEFYKKISDVFNHSEMCMNILTMSEDKDRIKKEMTKLKKFLREYQKKDGDE